MISFRHHRHITRQGFTLVELVLVIAFVALAVLGIHTCSKKGKPKVSGHQVQAGELQTTARLNMRRCPEASERCTVITTFAEGTRLSALGRKDPWIRVSEPISGASGWVHGAYVSRIESANDNSRMAQKQPPRTRGGRKFFQMMTPQEAASRNYSLRALGLSTQSIWTLGQLAGFIYGLLVLFGVAVWCASEFDLN